MILCFMPYQRLTDAALVINILMTDMLLIDATDSVVHWVDAEVVWSGDMNSDVTWSRNETVSRALSVTALSTER